MFSKHSKKDSNIAEVRYLDNLAIRTCLCILVLQANTTICFYRTLSFNYKMLFVTFSFAPLMLCEKPIVTKM